MEWFSLGSQSLPSGEDPRSVSFDLAKAGIVSARYVMIADRGKGISVDAVVSRRHAGSDRHADEVLGFFVGEDGDASTIGGALGEADYGSSTLSYAKLGADGWLILDMGAREEVVDGPGDDLEAICIGDGAIEVFVASGETQVETRRVDIQTTAFGSLSIESSRGTVIYLDGKEIGEAPRWIDNLIPGVHEIELRNPHDSYLERVNVEVGKVLRLTHRFLVEVPKVSGLAEKTAREKLMKLGFLPKVEYATDIEQLFGRVLRQSPEPGEKAEAGSTVVITVNSEARY